EDGLLLLNRHYWHNLCNTRAKSVRLRSSSSTPRKFSFYVEEITMTMSREEAAKKAAEARHNKSHEEESAIAKKAAETRKSHDPEAFKKMGQKGGSHSHGGHKEND